MSVYQIAKCPACGYNNSMSNPPKIPPGCPRCSTQLKIYPDWWMSYQHNGKRNVKRIGPRKKDAVAAYHKAKTNIAERRANLNVAPETDWYTAKEKFLEWAEESVSTKGLSMFRSCFNHLDRFFDHCSLDEITKYMVETEYVKARRKEGVRDKDGNRVRDLANGTINRELTTIHRMMVKCREWGLVEGNPIEGMAKLPEATPRERYLTDDEVTRLYAECSRSKNKMLPMIVRVALNTGLRAGDILTLRWSEIDFVSGIIRRQMQKSDKMNGIPMTPEIREALKTYRAGTATHISGYVFPSPRSEDGLPMRVDSDFGFEGAVERAGVKNFTFHDLRHTFATHFLRQMASSVGKDMALAMLQQILGHTDIKTTMRYAHVIEEDKRTAMEGFRIGG